MSILFDDYDEDPEYEALVAMGLAIPLNDPQPEPEDLAERRDYDAWAQAWRRRHIPPQPDKVNT